MYSKKIINSVWNKAEFVSDLNEKNGFRKDQCGAWIKKQAYGDRSSKYGWEIDHIQPSSEDGPDCLSNMRPLHWGNNASRQDGRLIPYVTSDGNQNIYVRTKEKVS